MYYLLFFFRYTDNKYLILISNQFVIVPIFPLKKIEFKGYDVLFFSLIVSFWF